MNDPIKIYKGLRDVYLKYISSGLPFFNDEYNEERKSLMKDTGTICQPPILEIVPKYQEYMSLYDLCIKEGIPTGFNDFIQSGLFYNDRHIVRKLYKHQYESLVDAFKCRKNIVVTTGTGSGKTECFLLPLFADLCKESTEWPVQGRTRAMRAMILYPLNALAEDQMIRLRKALNSRNANHDGALDWLDKNRNGNRFYFGRYTGATPVSGDRDSESVKRRLRTEKKEYLKDWEAAKEDAKDNPEIIYHLPCMEDDSAEMWDRISMQMTPPDILITNYSMLNIMLMRKAETNIFEQTRKWLKESPDHVFHLIVDELHTYRGTAGTEVSYLLKVFLDRLGLTPDSPQVQFLASSASMQDNEETKEYLCEFFGVNKSDFNSRFDLISTPSQPKVDKPAISIPVEAFKQYAISDNQDKLFEALSCRSFEDVTNKYQLVKWLEYGMSDNGEITAKDIYQIIDKLELKKEEGIKVLEGLLKILCNSKNGNNYVLPIREHLFFRSVNGLWACSNPKCHCVDPKYKFTQRSIGKMYKRPRNVCDCGANVLETIVCESCGELYLGGYLVKNDTSNKMFLSLDKPVEENFVPYCLIWKSNGKNRIEDKSWIRALYNCITGELKFDPDGDYYAHIQSNETELEFPQQCPICEVKYRNLSPLRHHRTGLQKVNQVLADALMRTLKKENISNPKLVLFSDSRQSAAKLSAGIEMDHYHDILRWSIINALTVDNENIELIKRYRSSKGHLTGSDIESFRELRKLKKEPFNTLISTIRDEMDGLLDDEEIHKLDKSLNEAGQGKRLDAINNEVTSNLLKVGISPAGPRPSLAKSNDIHWYDLFDFKNYTVQPLMGDAKVNYYKQIALKSQLELLYCIFAHKKHSFESMKLGYVSCGGPASSPQTQLMDSVIRILGEKSRINGYDSEYPFTESFPRQVRALLKKVFNISSLRDVNEKLEEVRLYLRQRNIIDVAKVALTGEGLVFYKSHVGQKYWVCPRCKTVHMQPSNGVCINCQEKLEERILTEKDLVNPDDYYLSLINNSSKISRLHCEELTGQTSKEDSRNRQRLFQDIYIKGEIPVVSGIDLLSVTTTMEAGVDIGSLSAVMMGNVPPKRFNYQQRVGRAGRRGNPLAVALTVARNNSHDMTHYFETSRMVSAIPKDPYLEVRTREIAERVIYKEVLNRALGQSNNSSDNVHGSFGSVYDWANNRKIVSDWISKNKLTVSRIIEVVTKETEITKKDKEEIKNFVNNKLVDKITEIATSDEYTQNALSERLANAGLLPMFGFPTRTRNLYLSMPKKLPADDVVTRDIDIAMSSFAPGHEIVKDKKIYKSVGIVDYEYRQGHIVPKWNSLNPYKMPLRFCNCCGYSSVTTERDTNKCPVCGNTMEMVKICSPLGFCVDYSQPPCDFNGSYDWYSPTSDIKLDSEESLVEAPGTRNLQLKNNVIPSQGLIHQINDNNGNFYNLGKGYDNIWYDADVLSYKKLQNTDRFAFVVTKSTGILTMMIKSLPEHLCLDPVVTGNYFEIHAAFLSWGYLVRKAAASYLDIETNELNVGFNIASKDGVHYPEIFLVENLENGAGYCNYLSGRENKNVPYDALVEPVVKGGSIYEELVKPEHARECIGSCYDCLRDFSNQKYHHILSWRLALDLAGLSNDKKYKIGFDTKYWSDYINGHLREMLSSDNISLTLKDGFVELSRNENKFYVIHPFWSHEYAEKKIGKPLDDIKTISVFDLSRHLNIQ